MLNMSAECSGRSRGILDYTAREERSQKIKGRDYCSLLGTDGLLINYYVRFRDLSARKIEKLEQVQLRATESARALRLD